MNKKRRVEKINLSLTPVQSVLLWLNEAKEYGFYEYVEWVAKNFSFEDSPQQQIYDRIEESVRHALRNQTKDLVDQAVNEACREAEFLIALALNINVEILHNAKVNYLEAVVLAEQLKAMLLCSEWRTLLPWRNWVIAHTAELLRTQYAVQIISDNLFQGHKILFSDAAAILESHIATIREIINVHNQPAQKSQAKPRNHHALSLAPMAPIHLDEIHKKIQPHISDKVSFLINKSKAEILVNRGRKKAATDLLLPYIIGESSE